MISDSVPGAGLASRALMVANCFSQDFGQTQRMQERFADALVPLHDQVLQAFRPAFQVRVLGRPVQHIEGTDVMDQSGQGSQVRVDGREVPGQNACSRSAGE